ncbi:acyl-CoA carboxylase subunit epsilon [Nocardia sp. NPDC004415]
MTGRAPVWLCVEKGEADAVELAALTALLVTRRRAAEVVRAPVRYVAPWRRLERRPGFTDPRAWTTTTR